MVRAFKRSPGLLGRIGLSALPLRAVKIHDELICANMAEAIAADVKVEKRVPNSGHALFLLLVRQST